jgi:hypothetical protein
MKGRPSRQAAARSAAISREGALARVYDLVDPYVTQVVVCDPRRNALQKEGNKGDKIEAQAFKRAASCFGLGRYLYNLPETWVDLDGQGKPTRLPALPNWALPQANSATGKTNPACGPRPPEVQRGPIDQRITGKIEGFRRILGDPLHGAAAQPCF